MISGVNTNYEVTEMIYMDTAASTMPSEAVIKCLKDNLDIYGNPSSLHSEGEKAHKLITNVTENIARTFNCCRDEIYYTSGATMSNNLFIQGFMKAHKKAKLVISSIEHNDIIELADYIDTQKRFKYVFRVPVDHNGFLNIDCLEKLLKELDGDCVLVCIQGANGECGTIQDIDRISRIVHSHEDMYLFSDMTQYVPYYKVDIQSLNLDGMSLSGQKIHCIKGVGLLYIKNGVQIDPLIFGEQGLIGGTENVLGIACLGTALSNIKYNTKGLIEKRDYFIESLLEKTDTVLVGGRNNRLPNNIYVKGSVNGESMVVMLSDFDICSSAGSACSSNGNKPSHVLLAMGYSPEDARKCVRFTIDENTTYEDIDYTVDTFQKLSII